jgi:hypothetical protein
VALIGRSLLHVPRSCRAPAEFHVALIGRSLLHVPRTHGHVLFKPVNVPQYRQDAKKIMMTERELKNPSIYTLSQVTWSSQATAS